jgi:ABC-type sulfate transport system substrate-binding protein
MTKLSEARQLKGSLNLSRRDLVAAGAGAAYARYWKDKVGQDLTINQSHGASGKQDRIPLVTINGQFGGWAKAQARHFADGGVFDQIYKPAV